ncbi:Lipase maturation factor 2, partial [Stegodyphus mimosarum]
MTGVDGRPEIVVEGSNSLATGWKEYHFLYKPGELSRRPPILIPHQPRLDWQMWFAALGNYEHNPWFVSFVYRILDGEKDVLDLLDVERLPFPPNKPPKYIRAILYKYSYTSPTSSSSTKKKGVDWWTR